MLHKSGRLCLLKSEIRDPVEVPHHVGEQQEGENRIESPLYNGGDSRVKEAARPLDDGCGSTPWYSLFIETTRDACSACYSFETNARAELDPVRESWKSADTTVRYLRRCWDF